VSSTKSTSKLHQSCSEQILGALFTKETPEEMVGEPGEDYRHPMSAEERAWRDQRDPLLETKDFVQYHFVMPGYVLMVRSFSLALACSRCKSVKYCSKEHQKKHWNIHKHVCN
jgi:hypothetical protein